MATGDQWQQSEAKQSKSKDCLSRGATPTFGFTRLGGFGLPVVGKLGSASLSAGASGALLELTAGALPELLELLAGCWTC